ncbi:MAG: GNAT family N-acetyltransferase [Acidimicrobiia bacterium]
MQGTPETVEAASTSIPAVDVSLNEKALPPPTESPVLLRRIRPFIGAATPPEDLEALTILAKKVTSTRGLWDDFCRAKPMETFYNIYASPNSLVFDICDGEGVVAFSTVIPRWRCRINIGLWTRRAVRVSHDNNLWKVAARVAMLQFDLHRIDGFVAVSNTLSIRIAERMGMERRGLIRGTACYDGVVEDRIWYEGDRIGAGLTDADFAKETSNGR